ncbi:MAG: exopolyphosphatase [Desulfovibrio sp.]|nr:MAG: exopolyphosphatase [Desulfovibrio sp.]
MRLLTRSDFDGLICAVLLKEAGVMDDWKFVHPKDVQDGKIDVTENDILANVPFVQGVGMWFDHHASEEERHGFNFEFKGASKPYPSCARVIWEYYGGHKSFPASFDEMMRYVDKCDSGDLTQDEVENPRGWVLLSFIMDPRTGLGRYRDYQVSNYRLMEDLIGYCRTLPIEQILELPDVKERVVRYQEQDTLFRAMIEKNARVDGNAVVLDLRNQDEIFTGNRFVIYTMYPQCNVSVQVLWGLKKQNTVFTVGHSIITPTCTTDVGSLMLRLGGGGHTKVGTCQVPSENADSVLQEILDQLHGDNA